MSDVLKRAAKALPHPLLMRTYHARFLKSERRKLVDASRRAGLPTLAELDITRLKSTETAFILGSGPSINAIPDERWMEISRTDTIGFNWWPLHPFVPKVYVFESIRSDSVLYPYFLSMFERRAQDYESTVKIVTDVEDAGFAEQLSYTRPTAFKRNMYVGTSVPVVARNIEELRAGLRFMRARGAFDPSATDWLFKYGGSVIAMITLAIRMRYKRIVLCGIDLGPQAYFYQDPELYPDSAHWEFAPRNQPHLTTRRLEYLVPAQEVIWTMNEEILQPVGIELVVESKSSTLYPGIPAL